MNCPTPVNGLTILKCGSQAQGLVTPDGVGHLTGGTMKKLFNKALDWVQQHPLIMSGIAALIMIIIVGVYTR